MPDFDVVDLEPADHPESGETAPDFTRPLVGEEYWEDRSLASLAENGRVVLVFTPMNGSFLARYIWDELVDRKWDTSDATVVGVTISTPYEHKRFVDDHDLPFELFSDPGNGVAEAYGIAHDLDGMAGVSEPRPAVFVVDGDRTVEQAWVASEWPDFPDYDALEAVLGNDLEE
ncbi:peroxiredoxin family protein [Natronoglomus mannanivorans]|uniref:Redoxin domain-containing protein n=1 Tax=Natronoglomus mannanivorans TaxID=2979990 RepID=A0AAP3E187_9EURY|nr:redoxin domain-containing protein [Halobacteria archaeon AArc-xg1-1]